ncbi:MAG: hypothetical protein ACREF3_02555, partial [Acetobacteraceae bacterium]
MLLVLTAAPARASILDWLLARVSSSVETTGLSIHFNGSLSADQVTLLDTKGPYVQLHHVVIKWSPLQLIRGAIIVSLLSADDVQVLRLPETSSSSSGTTRRMDVNDIAFARVELMPAVAGKELELKVDASYQQSTTDRMQLNLAASPLKGSGTYKVSAVIDPASVQARITAKEPAGGLLAGLADLPDLGAIDADATLDWPNDAIATKFDLTAGQMHATADGTVNLTGSTADLMVTANAPAMHPRPDLSWQAVSLQAHVNGPFHSPNVSADLGVNDLAAAGAAVRQVALQATGDSGHIQLHGELDGVVLPGRQPDLLEGAPVLLTADARLDAPDRPVSFTVRHPLLQITGDAHTAGEESAQVQVAVPKLDPIAADAGIDLQGSLALAMKAVRQGTTTQVAVDATLGITGGIAPAPALIGPSAHLVLAAALTGDQVTVSQLGFNGQDVSLGANGTLSRQAVALDWSAELPKLAPINPALTGGLQARGHLAGPANSLTLAADLSGSVGARGQSSGPFTAHLSAQGLPDAPSVQLTAQGDLLGSPLQVDANGDRVASGTLDLNIRRATWKSASAGGQLSLPAGTHVPIGHLRFAVGDFGDFTPLLGRKLTGSMTGALDATAGKIVVTAHAKNAGMPGTATIGGAALDATVANPDTQPVVDGSLRLTGISARDLSGGEASLTVKGPA